MPLYLLGLMGMTRRLARYDVPGWHPWLLVAAAGALLIAGGIACQMTQLTVSIRNRHALADHSGDPWDGRTLEWSTLSPPPAYNYAVLPNVEGEDAYWGMKQRAKAQQSSDDAPDYDYIDLPRNSATGVVCAFFASAIGFALIWHIWWLATVGILGAWATFVVFAWRDEGERHIPAAELARDDAARRAYFQSRLSPDHLA